MPTTIKKSVKQMVADLLRQQGEMSLKDISSQVSQERENVHPAHIRGVLNKDIKQGGSYFKRTSRGKYALASHEGAVSN